MHLYHFAVELWIAPLKEQADYFIFLRWFWYQEIVTFLRLCENVYNYGKAKEKRTLSQLQFYRIFFFLGFQEIFCFLFFFFLHREIRKKNRPLIVALKRNKKFPA